MSVAMGWEKPEDPDIADRIAIDRHSFVPSAELLGRMPFSGSRQALAALLPRGRAVEVQGLSVGAVEGRHQASQRGVIALAVAADDPAGRVEDREPIHSCAPMPEGVVRPAR
jgi:hypothetical protein